jgi:hypothetical protein
MSVPLYKFWSSLFFLILSINRILDLRDLKLNRQEAECYILCEKIFTATNSSMDREKVEV